MTLLNGALKSCHCPCNAPPPRRLLFLPVIPSSFPPFPPRRARRPSICPLTLTGFSVKQLTRELGLSPGNVSKWQPGQGAGVQGRKFSHTHRRLSQQRRYLFHTHNTLTEPVSASETLNRCTPPPKPFAPQVISSKCVHTGMSPRGVVVRMV